MMKTKTVLIILLIFFLSLSTIVSISFYVQERRKLAYLIEKKQNIAEKKSTPANSSAEKKQNIAEKKSTPANSSAEKKQKPKPFGKTLFLKGKINVKRVGGNVYLLYFWMDEESPKKPTVSMTQALKNSKGNLFQANQTLISNIKKNSQPGEYYFQAGPFDERNYKKFLKNLATGAAEVQFGHELNWTKYKGDDILVSADPEFLTSVEVFKIKSDDKLFKNAQEKRYKDSLKKVKKDFLRAIKN